MNAKIAMRRKGVTMAEREPMEWTDIWLSLAIPIAIVFTILAFAH
jgi:hypothetical protein